MANLTEISQFDSGVYKIETTDLVLGGDGVGDIANKQAKALANRTQWLLDHLVGYDGIASVSANTTIDITYLRKLIYVDASGNITLTIDDIANFAIGQSLVFKCKCVAGKAVGFVPTGSNKFDDGGIEKTTLWLCDGEQVSLVKRTTTQWEITDAKGNFEIVGNDAFVRKQPRNTIVANGCTPESGGSLLLRADYPRLWEAVEADAIADATWLSHATNYRGFFSTGNGTTTFRVPDMRAMYMRALDLNRGISIGRITASSGGYEPDIVKAHNHTVTDNIVQHNASGATIGETDGPSGAPPTQTKNTSSTGGSENVVKNIGLIPVIYY